MKIKTLTILATVMGVSAAVLSTIQAQFNGPSVETARRTVLLQKQDSWNGIRYKAYPKGQPELTMLKLTIAPHTALPWHSHPVPNAGYILSGSITVHDRLSGKTQTFHPGEAFAESVDTEHRGESGEEPTVLLITYAGAAGIPTSVPSKGEKAEY